MNNVIKNIMIICMFIVSLALIFIGQRNIGYTGLLLEVVGLFGLIVLLYLYNRKFK